jgi:hypothetical protein
VRKVEQGKVLKEKTNVLDHKKKLEAIEFVATTKQQGKDSNLKRKRDALNGSPP